MVYTYLVGIQRGEREKGREREGRGREGGELMMRRSKESKGPSSPCWSVLLLLLTAE